MRARSDISSFLFLLEDAQHLPDALLDDSLGIVGGFKAPRPLLKLLLLLGSFRVPGRDSPDDKLSDLDRHWITALLSAGAGRPAPYARSRRYCSSRPGRIRST